MKESISLLVAALAVSLLCAAADLADNQIEIEQPVRVHASRPRYLVKSCAPCGPNQCQVMGMQRFSEPRCEASGSVGSPCRPFQEAENKTLHFPHTILYCSDVYMQFCPCASGLECDPEEAECKRPKVQQTASGRFDYALQTDSSDILNQNEEDGDEDWPQPLTQQQWSGIQRFPWAVARFH